VKKDDVTALTKKDGGAALLIIVAILALIAALSIGTRYFGGSTRQLAQVNDIQQDNVHFEDAIASFAVQNSRLPCPADITLGTGQESGGGASACTSTSYAAEVLPWTALGLTENQVKDKWGNYYSYHVLDALVLTSAISSTNFDTNGVLIPTGLTIQSAGTSVRTDALFVVISHGKNGYGAYRTRTIVNSNPTDANELENTTDNGIFAIAGASGGDFDDVLTYWLATRP
jgi:hypothetical protein